MNATRKVKLKDITSNLTCKLCLGYLVDATTIIECLHSFCKGCIIKYLDKSADLEEKYCPVCDVQLHSTKPLTSIRSDLMLQEIVYKLVPGLFKDEMNRRRKFYEENKDLAPSNQLDSGQVFDELYITSDDIIHLSLEYMTDDVKLKESTRRYLKCPAAVSVGILKKLLQGKYDLDGETHIDVMFGDRILPDDFLLMDVAYKYSWTMNGSKPLTLSYRIRGLAKPVIKIEKTINDTEIAPLERRNSTQDELQTIKKVCNENGSNIMPTQDITTINPIKPPKNGLIPIAATKTPNGKIKNRKRKHLRYSDVSNETKNDIANSLSKRQKISKQDSTAQSKSTFQSQIEILSTNGRDANPGNKEIKEVQLQISENGVMSARSVASGEEKIIVNAASSTLNPSPTTSSSSQGTNIAEKLLFSGNFHSKTGPSGVTEIICDKPDPISSGKKLSTVKPGYVTLNIPNPTNPILPQDASRFQKAHNGNKASHDAKKSFQNGSSTPGVSTTNGKTPSKKKQNDMPANANVLQKIKEKIGWKANDGENANVIKAISDLGKLCNNNISEPVTTPDGQISIGIHNLPKSTSINNQFQQRSKSSCGGASLSTSIGSSTNFTLPLALNFSPSSGMSVSMIPCSSNASSNGSVTTLSSSLQITPPKRISHQTTVVNGDLKFTTSPKLILPKITAESDGSPKKPPKFFKSRHTTSPGSSPISISNQNCMLSPQHKQEGKDTKRKIAPIQSGKGSSEPARKKVKDKKAASKDNSASNSTRASNSPIPSTMMGQQNGTSIPPTISNLAHGILTNGISRPLTYPSTSDKYSQQLSSALNDPLGMSFGAAAAASVAAAAALDSNGVQLGLGMVPFVTDSYCSMPFINPRGIFPYNMPLMNYDQMRAHLMPMPLVSSTTTTTTKPNNAYSSLLGNSPRLSKETTTTLDLSVGKNTDMKSVKNQEGKETPVLVGLLNSSRETSPGKSRANLSVKDSKGKRSSSASPNAKAKQSGKSNVSDKIKSNGNGIQEADKNYAPPKNIDEASTVRISQSSESENKQNGFPRGKDDKSFSVDKNEGANKEDNKNNSKTSPESKKLETESNNSVPKIPEGNGVLEREKLLCLSAQNNNDHRMSNNHESTDEDTSTPSSKLLKKSLDCANSLTNGKSNGGSPAVTEVSSNAGSA